MFNVKVTREWLSREDTLIPTALLENMFLTSKIDAYEVQGIIVLDVPNALIQTNMPPKKDGEERLIVIITGVLVDILE